MAKQFFGSLVCVMAVLLVGRAVALAQTPAGDLLKGQGAYLKGLGSYNLNTAQAGSINVDSMIRWKSDLRKIQRERWNREAELAAGKQAKKEDVLRKLLEREQQLRVAATIDDVLKGDALNVLVYDLTDPDIKQNDWSSKTVSLPPGTSVKDLIFRFTPQSKQGAGATALSKGVIALSRLDIKGKWPTFMNIPALDSAKGAYENAYLKVRDEILADKPPLNSLLAMDRTLDALKDKVKEAVPTERDYRAQGLKFVDDLKAATRMFDAGTVDYAKDILTDTKNGDATTVAELVSFMLKYRLQFATSDRSPAATELYPKLYQALQQQSKELGIKPPEATATVVMSSLQNGDFSEGLKHWELEGDAKTFQFFGTANDKILSTFGKSKDVDRGRVFQTFMVPMNADKITFDVSGGAGNQVYISLKCDGKTHGRSSARNSQQRFPVEWDLKPLRGKQVTLEIVDEAGGGPWGHITIRRIKIVP